MAQSLNYIFLIDDDPIHLKITKMLLGKYIPAANIDTFTNADQAIDYLAENSDKADALPDVIFLDLNMPVMSGWEFLEALEFFYGKMVKPPVIFILSSSVDERDRIRSTNYKSVKNFISKPLSPENIEVIAALYGPDVIGQSASQAS